MIDPLDWFQSSPAPRCGCCCQECRFIGPRIGVSILTRTEVRVLPYAHPDYISFLDVSILTRTEVRVLPKTPGRNGDAHNVSILTRTEVRVLPRPRFHSARLNRRAQCFNPHPHRGAGAASMEAAGVSASVFQSSPAPRCGCCAAV